MRFLQFKINHVKKFLKIPLNLIKNERKNSGLRSAKNDQENLAMSNMDIFHVQLVLCEFGRSKFSSYFELNFLKKII